MQIHTECKKEKSKESKGKKIIFLLLLLFLVSLGGILAYFSDMISHEEQVKAGTIELKGEYKVYLNESQTQLNSITNLNPGDVIVIEIDITNIGSKSAWIREKLTLSSTDDDLLDFFNIYSGNYTQSDLKSTDLSSSLLEMQNGISVSSNRVIDGTGADAEMESGEDYTYIGTNKYKSYLTIYFLPEATNEAQGKTFNITILTQALQFRNNDTQEPLDSAWATVAALPSRS